MIPTQPPPTALATATDDPVARAYDRAAEHYDAWAWQRFWTRNEQPLLGERLLHTGRPGDRLLDVGCGTGRYLRVAADLGLRPAGIDVSVAMLARAADRVPGAFLMHLDVRRLRMAGRFDTVVCARVLCHLADPAPALAAMARALRPGGHLLLSALHPDHPFETTRVATPSGKLAVPTHKHAPDALLQAARAAGLDRVDRWTLDATTVRWLPPAGQLSSLDRTGARPVAWGAVLRRPATPTTATGDRG